MPWGWAQMADTYALPAEWWLMGRGVCVLRGQLGVACGWAGTQGPIFLGCPQPPCPCPQGTAVLQGRPASAVLPLIATHALLPGEGPAGPVRCVSPRQGRE